MKRIGFCTGIFDLLHKGHKAFFNRAAKHCDLLIIAVASDWITAIQKGQQRPEQDEIERVRAVKNYCKQHGIASKVIVTDELDFRYLADLGIVDVFIWGEDQKNVRPKGGEYEVVILPRTPNISTTKLLKGRK